MATQNTEVPLRVKKQKRLEEYESLEDRQARKAEAIARFNILYPGWDKPVLITDPEDEHCGLWKRGRIKQTSQNVKSKRAYFIIRWVYTKKPQSKDLEKYPDIEYKKKPKPSYYKPVSLPHKKRGPKPKNTITNNEDIHINIDGNAN